MKAKFISLGVAALLAAARRGLETAALMRKAILKEAFE